ncbi:hypothetical protein Hanom_Chr02g00099781 [Helianthus anomalus]
MPIHNFKDHAKNTTRRENETLLAIGIAYVQGEDVVARGLCSYVLNGK